MMIKRLLPWLTAAIAIWLLQIFVMPSVGDVQKDILVYAGINIVLAVSLNLVNGITGQFSMGHAGFMAVGAYTSAALATLVSLPFGQSSLMDGLIFVGLMIASGLAATVMGYVVGLPSLRLRGDYLAIVTLGFGEIIRVVLLNLDIVGGPRGLPGIPPLTQFGWVYTAAIACIFCIWRICHSEHGRSFLSVREDEIAAESNGVNTTKAKVRAFAMGAFFAGIAGCLFAHHLTFINPQTFDFNRSFEVIIMVVLGGMGSITGSVFAAVLLTFLREYLRDLQEYTQIDLRMIIYSLLLILMMLTRPNGILGTLEIGDIVRRLRQKSKKMESKWTTVREQHS